MFWCLVIISFIFSVLINFTKASSYKEELILYWGQDCFHIHHWLFMSCFILLLLIGRHCPDFVLYAFIAILLGAILEDFLYRNVLQIRTSCKIT
jgi:hypothetical protein